jgi:6-phosphogluconolactonase
MLACLVVLAGRAIAAEPVWFGTSTRGPAGAEGIYVSVFDAATGTLSPPRLAAAVSNPSFLALHPTRPLIVAVSETTGDDGKLSGAVASFAIEDDVGLLRELSRQPTGGGGACHVSIDPSGRAALAANYGGGSVVCLGLEADGHLRPVTSGTTGGFVQHVYDRSGQTGFNPKRQEQPHAHSIYPTADSRFAVACDLGLDQVIIYALDPVAATLAPHAVAEVAAGAGPRHFAFHPSGRFGYCVNELDLTVTAFTFDAAAGRLVPFQTLPTIPDDVVDREGFSTAEIVAHPSGRFLYASNRGHDSIAMYAVAPESGRLQFLGVEPTRCQTPRNFVLHPSGRFLLAAGMNSNTVTVFTVDEQTGRLTFTGQSIDVPSPMCIRFRPAG